MRQDQPRPARSRTQVNGRLAQRTICGERYLAYPGGRAVKNAASAPLTAASPLTGLVRHPRRDECTSLRQGGQKPARPTHRSNGSSTRSPTLVGPAIQHAPSSRSRRPWAHIRALRVGVVQEPDLLSPPEIQGPHHIQNRFRLLQMLAAIAVAASGSCTL